MSPNLPSTTSSRSGRFKKKMVTLNALETEAPILAPNVTRIVTFFRQGKLSDAEFTALYIIIILAHRFPSTWPGAKRSHPILGNHQMKLKLSVVFEFFEFEKNVKHRLEPFDTVGDLFNNFALRSTPQAVNRALLEWSNKSYGLELMFNIPTPKEVLAQQKSARRVVTVLTKEDQLSRYILNQRDALSFTMHDLIHADHFYHDNQCFQGQLGFYQLLHKCIEEGHFDELLKNEHFESEFEYLISDMNAYAVHLLKCLKASIIHYHPNHNEFFNCWIKKLEINDDAKWALLKLNGPLYNPVEDDHLLLQWLNPSY